MTLAVSGVDILGVLTTVPPPPLDIEELRTSIGIEDVAGRHSQEDEREGDRYHGMAVLQVSYRNWWMCNLPHKLLFQMGHLCGQESPQGHSPMHSNHGSLRGRIKTGV